MLIKISCLLLGLTQAQAFRADTSATTQTPLANCPEAQYCPETCVPPSCLCSGNETVVDLEKRPQILYLTYDDAFTQYAMDNFYSGLFDGTFKNPDGCPIRATHFLTAAFTDFTLVHQYWTMGHEMASHSITHRTNQDYWKGLNVDGWSAEAEGMRKMISQFAAIPREDITGFRAPFLQMGGDEMYTALSRDNFKYDCSWASRDFGYLNLDTGLYPYTMDYRSIQDCPIEPCPKCSYPGFAVQPMLDLEDMWLGADPNRPNNGMPCSMLDGCIIIQDDADETTVFDMLWKNFIRNRDGTRAPMGLYMHAGWFFGEQAWHYEGYKLFLKKLTEEYNDVWIVPVSEGIDYVTKYNDKSNEDLIQMGETSPFSCKKFEGRPKLVACAPINPCRFENVTIVPDITNQERYVHICGKKPNGQQQSCPTSYPWLDNPCGGNLPCL